MKSLITLLLASLFMATSAAHGVQVQDLIRLKGAEANKLVGMGIIVGLKGTGDGGKFAPSVRSLASAIQNLVDPTVIAAELKDTKNVALVAISVSLPASGVREGDKVDVHVSAIAAKSLEGGRLFLVPLIGPMKNSPVFAFAEGAVVIEDKNVPTVGLIRSGAQLTR
ncbi:MAG: flagellar basal body P-ring protein FlgI, partial [Phycisphaeraceae bacterium]